MKRVRGIGVIAVAFLLVTGSMAFPAAAVAETVYNVDRKGVAIKGYDPVAYFTQEMPVKGSDMYELEWEGAKWRFASSTNLDMFREDPAKYAPRYGGYCAYGVAVGGLYNIKPEAWSIEGGTLYLNKNLRIRETWRKDIPGYIKKSRRKLAAPYGEIKGPGSRVWGHGPVTTRSGLLYHYWVSEPA